MPASPSHPNEPHRAFVVAALRHRLRILMVGRGADAAAAEFLRAWQHLVVDDEGDVDRELTIEVPEGDPTAYAAAQARASALITLSLIELNAGHALLFHAAAATDADGRAVLLVGPSGAGKTTAVAHLARSTSYLTDETSLVDEDDGVLPYPKPLSLLHDRPEKVQVAPADLGLPVPAKVRVPLARVVIIDRDDDASRVPAVDRLSTADGILAVVPQLSALSAHPAPLIGLARLSRHVGGFERLTYFDVHDIDPEAGIPTSPRAADPRLEFSVPPCRLDEGQATEVGLVRAPVDDAIETEEFLLLAHRGRVRALSGIARTTWLEAARPTSADDLLCRLREIHGRAPDDARDARRIADGLVGEGVLEWRT